jgi:hypothetical protein
MSCIVGLAVVLVVGVVLLELSGRMGIVESFIGTD